MTTAIKPGNSGGSEWIKRSYETKDADELKNIYEDWAQTYDAEVGKQDYVAPTMTVQAVLAANGRLDGEVLDAGCGTGLCGVALSQAGAKTIDGIDLSPGMLKIARNTGVFRNLDPVDMTKPIDKPDNTYDVVTCVGTLTHGHVGPSPALKEMVRILKKGGVLAATIVADIWKSGGFEAEVERLKEARLVDVVSTEAADYRVAANVKARILVLRKK